MARKEGVKHMKRTLIISASILLAFLGFSSFGLKSDGFEISKQIEIFVSFYEKLNQNYVDPLNPGDLMSKAIKGITKELDPYTKFRTEKDILDSKIRQSGEYTGIGSGVFTKKGQLFISEPYQDFPADAAGMKAGDEIIQIDDILVSDFKGDAKDLLKGEVGTDVLLKFKRQGQLKTTKITRGRIDVDAVPYYELLSDNIGYIVLQKFNKKASSQTIDALKELKQRGATKVILDLRGNPGGLLTEAVNVCNIFIPKGQLIVNTESVIPGNVKTYKTKKAPVDLDIPLAVLVNGRSASASEIVSGVIQDLDRGVIVGSRSFGKGLVQSTKRLKYDTQLKVTTSRYFIPSGRCVQSLDYWNRDANGRPVRTQKGDYKAFKTLNKGRTVYDGGGVLPDVVVGREKLSSIARALLKERMIFNFATDYSYSHSPVDVKKFQLSDSDYEGFLAFLKKEKFEYKTKTENLIEDLEIVAEKEEFDKTINANLRALEKSLKGRKEALLLEHKKEISILITDQILKNYHYREGMLENHAVNNEEVLKAQMVLLDQSRYNKILGK